MMRNATTGLIALSLLLLLSCLLACASVDELLWAPVSVEDVARTLGHDPWAIVDYVREEFDYEPAPGYRKCPWLTIAQKAGNDWELTALLVALLRAAGCEARFVTGHVEMPVHTAMEWLSTHLSQFDQVLLAPEEIPEAEARECVGISALLGKPATYRKTEDGYVVRAEHVWARALIEDDWYEIDPSFKLYEYETGIDLDAALDYDEFSFMRATKRGARIRSDSVQKLNGEVLSENLAEYSIALQRFLEGSTPNATLSDVVGGWTRVVDRATKDGVPFESTLLADHEVDAVPEDQFYSIDLSLPELGWADTLWLHEISGKRVVIHTDAEPTVVVSIDGDVIADIAVARAENIYTLRVSARLPAGDTDTRERLLVRGQTYVLSFLAGGGPGALLPNREELLRQALLGTTAESPATGSDEPDRALSSTHMPPGDTLQEPQAHSPEVIGETLHLMVLSYLDEMWRITYDLVAPLFEARVASTYRCAFASTVNGYTFDLWFDPGLRYWRGGDDSVGSASLLQLLRHIQSACEHAHIEQLQGIPAVSAISGLAAANAQGLEIYQLDAENWEALLPELRLSDAAKEHLQQVIEQDGLKVIVPDGQVQIGDWEGEVWIADGHVVWTRVPVQGGVSALPGAMGQAFWPNILDERSANSASFGNRSTPDLRTGAFRYQTNDLILPSLAPDGLLSFARRYSSASAATASTIGNGWRHSYDISIEQASQWSHVSGDARALEVVQLIEAAHIAGGLCEYGDGSRALDRTMRAVLVVDWMFDQLLDNTVTVSGLDETVWVFRGLADGSFNSPQHARSLLNADARGGWVLTLPDDSHISFGPEGLAQEWMDRDGHRLSFTYDEDLLVSVTEESGRAISLFYERGRVARVEDWTGRAAIYEYDPQGQLMGVSGPCNVEEYRYDDAHRLESRSVDPDLRAFAVGYDTMGRLTSARTASGRETEYVYGDRRTLVVDPRGAEYFYEFDPDGHVIRIRDPLGYVSTREYDSRGSLIREADALGNTASFSYDPFGDLIEILDPMSNVTTYSYDERGRLIEATDTEEATTRFSYDEAGHLISLADPLDRATRLTYDAHGNLVAVREDTGAETLIGYDSLGDVVSITDPQGQTWGFESDELSRVSRIENPYQEKWSLSYTDWGALAQLADPLGQSVQFTFDSRHLLTAITDALGYEDRFSYDEDGNLISLARDDQLVARYEYDEGGAIVSAVNGNGSQVLLQRDLLGRLDRVIDALGRETRFTYDSAGRVIREVRADDSTIRYEYDAVGRVTLIVHGPGDESIFSYDNVGRIVAASRQDWRVEYAYDRSGRIVSASYPHTGVELRYSYDSGDVPDSLQMLCRGEEVASFSYTYDLAGRLVELRDVSGSYLLRRDGVGRLAGIKYSNGASAVFEYDAVGRIARVASTSGTGTLIFSETYLYDPTGNVTEIVYEDPFGSSASSFGYDLHHQLVRETTPSATWRYVYDLAGNRLRQASETAETEYEYDAADELLSAGNRQLTYDLLGNTTRIATGEGEWVLAFASDDRLRSLRTPGGSTTQFAYDAFGRPAWRSDGGKATWFIYDISGGLLAEVDAAGSPQAVHTLASGIPLLSVHTGAEDSSAVWYHHDRLGTVRSMSGVEGDAISSCSYDPFGSLLADPPESLGTFAFVATTGALREPSMPGLYMMGGRPYLAELGRFLTQDPIWIELLMSGRLNPYDYAANNPLKYVDPTGLYPIRGGTVAEDSAWIDPWLLSKSIALEKKQEEAEQLRPWRGPEIVGIIPREPSPRAARLWEAAEPWLAHYSTSAAIALYANALFPGAGVPIFVAGVALETAGLLVGPMITETDGEQDVH